MTAPNHDSTRHNIVGIVVRSRPESVDGLRARLTEMHGVEVHATTEDGRFVVTIEGADRECGDSLLAVHRLEGVLAASLVTHHFETDPETVEQLETSHAAN